MAQLTRKLLKLFAGSAPQAEMDVFGSLAAGSLQTSLDPDDIQSLSAWEGGWADEVMDNDSPVLEDRNAVDYVFAWMLKSIFQQGVPNYLATETYYIGSIVNSSGVLYQSIADDNTGNAVTDGTKWQLMARTTTTTFASPTTVGGATAVPNASAVDNDIYLVGTAPAWAARAQPAARAYTAVAWSKQKSIFAAVTNTNHCATSPDGITWTERAGNAAAWTDVIWVPELALFVAVRSNGGGATCVQTSPDGITWTARTSAADIDYESVAWSPELRLLYSVARSGSDRVQTSPDGVTWTARSASEANSWKGVCWSSELGKFVAVSSDGTNRVMYSIDGVSAVAASAAEANAWNSVCWSPQLMLFCAVASSGTNRVMTSPDGITWTARAAAEANSWEEVRWSPEWGIFVAISSDGTNRTMTSPDGITWTAKAAAEANDWKGLCWSPELHIFAATSLSGTNRFMTISTPIITASSQIVAGTVQGQRKRLIGTSNVNAVLFLTGTGLLLKTPFYLKENSVLDMFWDNGRSLWVKSGSSD